jgi:hypothetical protein
MTLKDRAIADYEALCGDVANYGPWWLNFKLFVGLHVGHNFTLNEDRSGRYFPLYSGLLTDDYVRLGNDFPFDLAIDSGLTVEVKFAVDLGAGPQVRADVR